MSKPTQSHLANFDLARWLDYLETIHSTEIDLGLDRISLVANRLAIDLSFAQVITVAGTNGKGTTCAFLENFLLAQKQNVAVYSSPHIERFNERLRLNQQEVDDQALITAFRQVEQARADISLTYYEFTTLAAFLVLMSQQPEVIILEVGLGGRLDATNIIDADIAVITAIDLDHQAFLGNTREAIGAEKAGIFKTGKLAVVGEIDLPNSVVELAKQQNISPFYRGQAFNIVTEQHQLESAERGGWTWQSCLPQQTSYRQLIQPSIPLANVATSIMVLTALGYSLTTESINHAITETKVAGRTEIIPAGKATQIDNICDLMLDVAHNPHAAKYLATVIAGKSYQKIFAIVGMLKDKDINATLAAVLPQIDYWYCATLDMPRGAQSIEISEQLAKLDQQSNCFDNVYQAFTMALQNASKDDLVLVFGSFFTVAEIRRQLVS